MRTVGATLGGLLVAVASIAILAFCIWAITPPATADVYTPGYWQSCCIVVLVSVLGSCFRPWKTES